MKTIGGTLDYSKLTGATMTGSSIGGAMNYDLLAQQHRPRDESAMARECYRLVSTGLRPRDVAMALRLDLGEVLALLRMSEATR